MEDYEVATAAGPSGGKISALGGLWQVIIAPGAFFEKLKKDPKILVPWVVIALIGFLFLWFNKDLLFEFQKQIAMQRNPDQAAMMDNNIVRYSIPIVGSLFIAVAPLLTAALAFFWGNVVFAGKAKFKQVLSVVLYAGFVFSLGYLVTWPLWVAKNSVLVSLSLAALVADQPTSFAYLALSKVGVFYVWEFVVASIGFYTIYGFAKSKGYWIAILSLGLISIIHACSALFQ